MELHSQSDQFEKLFTNENRMSSLAELVSLVDGDGMYSLAEINLVIFNGFVCFGRVTFIPAGMRPLRWRRWILSFE